ncbi:MAG: NAD+ synthase [Candidatus Poribacteria bacterium]
MKPLEINTEKVSETIENFIRQKVNESGYSRVIIGLSGGIDSSTVAYVAKRALGAENVFGINMPYRSSNPQSAADAKLVAENLGINFKTIEITDMVDAYFENYPDANMLRRGNFMARERMVVLYDQSALLKALVLGCGNKTEILLGYCTLYGDTACAMIPLGDLYKTQVRALAKYLSVPEQIILKTPTADLWPGQSDEGEMGFTYENVDRLLYFMIEKRYTLEELKTLGFDESFINQVADRIKKNRYKRCLPPIPKINNMFLLNCVEV